MHSTGALPERVKIMSTKELLMTSMTMTILLQRQNNQLDRSQQLLMTFGSWMTSSLDMSTGLKATS